MSRVSRRNPLKKGSCDAEFQPQSHEYDIVHYEGMILESECCQKGDSGFRPLLVILK